MPRPTKAATESGLVLTGILRRLEKLSNTANSLAWGTIGGTTTLLVVQGFFPSVPPSVRSELCAAMYAIAMAIYTLVRNSTVSTRRCLATVSVLFTTQQINAAEYAKARNKCLKRAGLV